MNEQPKARQYACSNCHALSRTTLCDVCRELAQWLTEGATFEPNTSSAER